MDTEAAAPCLSPLGDTGPGLGDLRRCRPVTTDTDPAAGARQQHRERPESRGTEPGVSLNAAPKLAPSPPQPCPLPPVPKAPHPALPELRLSPGAAAEPRPGPGLGRAGAPGGAGRAEGSGDPGEEPPAPRERSPGLGSLSRVAAAVALRGPGLSRAAGTDGGDVSRAASHQAGDRWPWQPVTASPHGWGQRDGREAQTLGLAGAQTPQLLVDPPWEPAVLWDEVTLTCQGSGTAGATTWYKDRRYRGQQGRHRVTVTESGTYRCARPGSGHSLPVTVSDDWLVLQVPARALLEGDTVTLRCRGWRDKKVTEVSFYHEGQELGLLPDGTELSLSPLELHHSGRYRCKGRLGWWEWKESAPVTVTVQELFPVPVLEGPPEPTEGSPLNLSCLSTPSPLRPRARLLHVFYRDGQRVGGPQGSPQLLVPAVGVSHSGNYSCEVRSEGGAVRKSSARLRVTVRRVPPSGVSLWAQPPGGQVALGDRLVLSCAVATGTGPRSFSWHREGSGAPLGTGPHLELPHVGDNDSGHYRCRVSDGDSVAESDPLNVTVLVPVANATITPAPPAHQVCPGDPVTLRCSVQVGSAPVTFTWLHNGQEVARGPLLELGNVSVAHSGTYQCVATNQLGQDEHRALSPELALTVTPWGHRDTAVAAGVGGSLLALVLLVGAIVGWQRCHHRASRTPQDRTPVVPPEGGEVLYTHVVPTARAAGERGQGPGATPEAPQVTYAELPGPRWHPGDSGDYENVL
ncbi:Fc receptor-like protein 2 [Vidua chalybeata]|uniref:Fc receptor-like protein 2 n=1 Tax=Vidua chalybeata TaxID=81927 RepID=UPI0023A90055|nr:Fc receptor-like protein 2 [Vidua chalybeata]